MNRVFLLIAVIVVIIIIYYSYNESLSIISRIDNKDYIIRRGHLKTDEYLQSSADTLAEINVRVEKLIVYLDKKYSKDTSKNYFILKLKQNYKHSILSEAAVDKRYTTYTIDKRDMHICLRTRDHDEKLYDINLLMYVVLHELAHLCNYDSKGIPIQGHGQEFRMIFGFLVKEAINVGIYEYVDYNAKPREYCGMFLNSSII